MSDLLTWSQAQRGPSLHDWRQHSLDLKLHLLDYTALAFSTNLYYLIKILISLKPVEIFQTFIETLMCITQLQVPYRY